MADEKLSEDRGIGPCPFCSRPIDYQENERLWNKYREHEDAVPLGLHEELRQVMLGERRRAEKAEWEGQQVVEALLGEPVPVPLPTGYYPIAVAVRDLRIQLRETERERDEVLSADYHCPQCGETLVTLARTDLTIERDAALARVRELEADISARDEQLAAVRSDLNRLAAACGAENPPGPPDLPERVRADAEELAAFRFVARWCALRGRFLQFDMNGLLRVMGVGDTWYQPAALATALDPNWRKASEHEEG